MKKKESAEKRCSVEVAVASFAACKKGVGRRVFVLVLLVAEVDLRSFFSSLCCRCGQTFICLPRFHLNELPR